MKDEQIVKFEFEQNTIDGNGMVNITALSRTYQESTGKRKDPRNWLVTNEAKESIAYLERVTGFLVSDLAYAEHGVGTWVHADLAEIFAQWISVEYRFAVVQLIRLVKSKQKPVEPEFIFPTSEVEWIEYALKTKKRRSQQNR
jgi:KilA-N domain